jgi:hypothetical protein
LLLAWKAASAQTLDVKTSAWDLDMLEVVIDAFAALTEPGENDYLREVLALKEFVQCRQRRAELARKCLKHIGRSASFVSTIEIRSDDTEETRLTLVHLRRTSSRVRLLVALASAYFFLIWLFPRSLSSPRLQVASYREFLRLASSYRRVLDSEG